MSAFLHWLNVEVWSPMWPNTLAPSVWTLLAVAVAHVRATRQWRRNHKDMKQHLAGSVDGRLDELAGRVAAIERRLP